jgi:hypothetical protein
MAFGPLRLVAGALHFQTPLRQSGIVVRLQFFEGQACGFDRCWCDGLEKSISDCLLDHCPADVETVHAAAIDQILATAMIARRRVPAAVVNMQTAAAVSASDDALQ